jgi:hypothetical protein
VFTDVNRFGLVWAAVGGCLALLVLPVAIASNRLTTLSLGSCDAADYAAGARTLMEFARSDRAGFLGLSEVVSVQSVDNFFDYWLRLNHFTPSALMALNGTVLVCAPHEIATLMTAVLLAGALPVVFWMSRAVTGYSGGVSMIVTGLFGVSPIMWYAVAHVSPSQLIAAQAVSLLTWAGVSLWRGRLTWRRGVQFTGVLALAYWLILGSYNFLLLVCLVPSLAYAGGLALIRRDWLRFGRWLAFVLLPLVACGMLFPARVAGLAERLTLLRTYDFGWPVPGLTAEGWLGMVQGPTLEAWSFFGLRWVLAAGEVGLLVWALLRAVQQRLRVVWLLLAVVLPVMIGYFWLEARGARLGTNASYDAYKLFAVFYPLLLPIFCWWVTLRRSQKLHDWLLVGTAGIVVVGFNLIGCGMFIWKMSRPPLIVDGELRQLRKVEAMPDVKSVNLIVPDMWSRLWANAFLLRKEQYFRTHTYEGRRNTELRGEWDLEGGLIAVELPEGARREVTPRFALVDTRHPEFVRAEFADGWHLPEVDPRSGERWRWSSGEATLRFDNPHEYPLTVQCRIDGWSPRERRISFVREGGEPRPSLRLGDERATATLPALGVPPGQSTLVLQTDEPPFYAPGDPRPLGVSVFQFTITPQR